MDWLLDPGRLTIVLRVLTGLFLLLLLFVVCSLRFRTTERIRPSTIPMVFVFLFLGIILYQSSWQIGGFMRRGFVAFMQSHDPRPNAATGSLQRGRIFSVDGQLLAGNGANTRRAYPYGEAFCHLVGYSHPVFGESGMERSAADFLYGQELENAQDWERFGRRLFSGQAEVAGNDLVLTLHAGLQSHLHYLFAGRPGAAIVMRPADGAILAMLSSPGFDPGFSEGRLPHGTGRDAPMFNRALSGRYPPGSTFKVVIAALALEAGFDGTLDCPAQGYTPGGGVPPVRDHEYYVARRRGTAWEGHGRLTLTQAFVRSSNTFFAQLGVWLRPERLAAGLERFNFSQPIRIYEGASGLLESGGSSVPGHLKGGNAAVVQTAIGQGELGLSPLHLAMMVAAIANGGTAMTPGVVRDGPPRRAGVWFTPDVARKVGAMMRETVTHGTGRGANVEWLQIAGKTGTAQTGTGDDHSWFVSMAPSSAPTLCMVVVLDNAGYGSSAALPLSVMAWKYIVESGLINSGDVAGE